MNNIALHPTEIARQAAWDGGYKCGKEIAPTRGADWTTDQLRAELGQRMAADPACDASVVATLGADQAQVCRVAHLLREWVRESGGTR